MLHTPTAAEIAAITARGIDKHPALAARWERAAAVLTDRRLHWDGSAWSCRSSDNETVYAVDFARCTCPDAQRRHDLTDGRAFCKHRLALLALREYAIGEIADRLIGAYRDGVSWRQLKAAPNSGILIANRNGACTLYWCADPRDKIPAILCAAAYTPRGAAPATPADLGAFLLWLDTADPLPAYVAAQLLFSRLVRAGEERADAAAAADELAAARRLAAAARYAAGTDDEREAAAAVIYDNAHAW